MIEYLSHYGWHFNRKMCKFALQRLPKEISILDKNKVNSLLDTYNIKLENNQLYDHIYLTNYAMSVYFGSSITDEKHLMLFVKDTLDKQEDGTIFTIWYASMCKFGIPIDWEDML